MSRNDEARQDDEARDVICFDQARSGFSGRSVSITGVFAHDFAASNKQTGDGDDQH